MKEQTNRLSHVNTYLDLKVVSWLWQVTAWRSEWARLGQQQVGKGVCLCLGGHLSHNQSRRPHFPLSSRPFAFEGELGFIRDQVAEALCWSEVLMVSCSIWG